MEITELQQKPFLLQEDTMVIDETEKNLSSNKTTIQRGKFRSLTLINWNGFFARSFDLDVLITTLSGGNGAGKSTTMAAFVAVLIPDLSLLHFRNTTEAGATSGSRDKGLHGKLRPGVCYAALDTSNSRNQRVIVGVRLQQIAGRDKKVDIKPFTIQNVPLDSDPISLFTEKLNAQQARVLSLNELKDKTIELDYQFKVYSSIIEYHSMMFEFGIIPKRLRSSSDRNKFYKLIEASLYGGISSAITRSLRDYLLPENLGVRKAFQDMESALRENRMTLEAIKVTQADRDLFKHLIAESTQYVSADYMRHANQRKGNIETGLELRKQWRGSKQELVFSSAKITELTDQLKALVDVEHSCEIEYQSASDHLNSVTNALRDQEKIGRYQEDIDVLKEQLEEQKYVVEAALEDVQQHQMQHDEIEQEAEQLHTQLVDYQQALNAQQTRYLQYQQAIEILEKAKTIYQLTDLSVENVDNYHQHFLAERDNITSNLFSIEQKLTLLERAKNQFDQAYQLVCKLVPDTSRASAWQVAKQQLADFLNKKNQAQQLASLQIKLNELENSLAIQEDITPLLASFDDVELTSTDELENYQGQQEAYIETLDEQLTQNLEQRTILGEKREQLTAFHNEAKAKAPAWLIAQNALDALCEKSGSEFTTHQDVIDFMQQQLSKERELLITRDKLEHKKQQLQERIYALSQPDGSENANLNVIAEQVNGILLSELYEDVALEDASYFSALYGPAKHAIVVRNLSEVKASLPNLEQCPEDLYFIQGDPISFDDNVYTVQELEKGIAVEVSARELRFSQFLAVPVFGRAAREKHLQELSEQAEIVAEEYAQCAFEVQKCQRLHQQASEFISLHLNLAFEPNPEVSLQKISNQQIAITKELSDLDNGNQHIRTQIAHSKEKLRKLVKLISQSHILFDETLFDQVEECKEQLAVAEEYQDYVDRYHKIIEQLEPIVQQLQSDPEHYQQLKQDYDDITLKQKEIQQKIFLLADISQRKSHFSYQDSASLETNELTKQLRTRWDEIQKVRQSHRDILAQKQKEHASFNQTYLQLRSAFDAKNNLLTELIQEIKQLGIRTDEGAEQRAKLRRDELQQKLAANRQSRSNIEKQLALLEKETESFNQRIRKAEREYKTQRGSVVDAKRSWCSVLRLCRVNGVEKRLNRRELAYLSADELRSMSDKALGALRFAVANNEYLRDSLRASEDNRKPEYKVQFFIDVYQHLRQRIRQDIIKIDDPIDAIEQMEIELSRLTEELTGREEKLAISAESVANIMRKTIQREQNRIHLLNHGLQNIAFGQVKSVRLVVNIRETHATLLTALSAGKEEYGDLFNNNKIAFSEALAMLYQRLNPHIEMGQRSPQIRGEELLDYRNYLELEVEVYRGTDGWLRAESGALSTGEAIGTGMSILLMVVQSWEEESRRMRGKDILPCRLLFLDEAARLDAKSISTLFELCERLDMQLLIAAPENISPEKGTTYKLVRKITANQEYVHVVGLKGFA